MGRLQPARRGVGTSQARVLRLLLRKCVRWRDRVSAHANSVCSLEAAAGMSEHGRATRKRAVALAHWASIGHGPTPTSATGRARVASARAEPRPTRERAQWRASALHAQAASRSEGQGWNVGARPCAARRAAFRSCSALPQRTERVPPARRGARARRKCTCWASSQERASAVVRKRATRASHLTK